MPESFILAILFGLFLRSICFNFTEIIQSIPASCLVVFHNRIDDKSEKSDDILEGKFQPVVIIAHNFTLSAERLVPSPDWNGINQYEHLLFRSGKLSCVFNLFNF